MVVFDVAAMHRRQDLWGNDSNEFRPERWQNEKGGSVSGLFTVEIINYLQDPRNSCHSTLVRETALAVSIISHLET